MQSIDSDFVISLKYFRKYLTKKQYLTLRGQALAGDTDGAKRGLATILGRVRASERRNNTPK